MTTPTAAPAPNGDHDGPRPKAGPGPAVLVLKALASLQLTVVLFALSILLVFFGTVAQVDYGIWTVVERYFWSWVVMVPFDLFAKFAHVFCGLPRDVHWAGAFPFPAGKLLGGALLVNLLAAHIVRFRVTWKRSGVLLLHSGMILLFVGEFVTREYAIEQRMIIPEGESVGYTQDARHVELAFVDASGAAELQTTAVPESLLQKVKTRIDCGDLGVEVEPVEYMVNSSLEPSGGRPNPATVGAGLTHVAVKRREASGADTDQKVDMPAVYFNLYKRGGESLGTFLGSAELKAQPVVIDGKKYQMSLRFKRYYKPYTLSLTKFRFDRYMGTDKPKNYSSEVVLADPEQGVEREVTIRMNEPLRHRGETFYQGGFDPSTETTTILQVVKNPGWLIPYVSCVVVTIGMTLHFVIHLTQFLRRRAKV